MKLLLWTCILYTAFAKKRFHFPDEKVLSSGEKDYSGNHNPLNPSLNIPYSTSDINLAPFPPSGNKISNYPGNPDPDSGVPSNPWILNSPGALPYHSPSLPMSTWLVPSPSPPQKSSLFISSPSSRLAGPFLLLSTVMPTAAEPYIATPLSVAPTTPPHPKRILMEPGPIQPDEAEPDTSEHTSSSSPD